MRNVGDDFNHKANKTRTESFQNTQRKNIDKQKTKKQKPTTTTTSMEDSSSPSSWKALSGSTGWALRWAGSSVLLQELFLLQWQQRKRTQWRWTWRKEKHKTRVPRYSLSLSHTHICFLVTKALPRHYHPTFQLSRYKNKLNLLVTLVPWSMIFISIFVVNFAIFSKNILAKEFSFANSLFFFSKLT